MSCSMMVGLRRTEQRPLRDSLVESRALDQFHDEGGILDTMYRCDVWVIERREDLRLSREARHAVGVGSQRGREDLDGHFTSELVSVALYTSPMPPSPIFE